VPDTGGIDGLFLPKPTRSQGSSRRLALSSLRQLLPAQCSILVYSISKGFFPLGKAYNVIADGDDGGGVSFFRVVGSSSSRRRWGGGGVTGHH
jgi:hypothetical protein